MCVCERPRVSHSPHPVFALLLRLVSTPCLPIRDVFSNTQGQMLEKREEFLMHARPGQRHPNPPPPFPLKSIFGSSATNRSLAPPPPASLSSSCFQTMHFSGSEKFRIFCCRCGCSRESVLYINAHAHYICMA